MGSSAIERSVKVACLGALGVVTLWKTKQASGDEIYTGATVSGPADLSHAHVVYTSNVSVVVTDNTTIIPTAVEYINYETGSVGVTGLTTSTAGTFDLDFADPSVTIPDGDSSAGVAHMLTLVGVNSQNQLVFGETGSAMSFSEVFRSNSYADVLAAVDADSDSALAAMILAPVVSSPPSTIAFGPGVFESGTSGTFNYYTFVDETSSGMEVVDGNGEVEVGTITIPDSVPEPGTAAVLGAGVAALASGRRRKRV